MDTVGQEVDGRTRSALYIDGFNLYHAVNDLGEDFLKWCNFWRLGEIIIPQRSEQLVKVVFCTTYYPGDIGKKIHHERFIKALNLYNVKNEWYRVDVPAKLNPSWNW